TSANSASRAVASSSRSQPGREAGGVPEGKHFDSWRGIAVVEVVPNTTKKNSPDKLDARRNENSEMRRVENEIECFGEIFLEGLGRFVAILEPPLCGFRDFAPGSRRNEDHRITSDGHVSRAAHSSTHRP